MTVEDVASAHAERQVALARRTSAELGRLWRQVDKGAIGPSWRSLLGQALVVLGTSQATAAASAGSYVDDALEDQDVDFDAAGRINPGAFAGIASDGRPLASLLEQPAITALTQIGRGVPVDRALASGVFTLDLIARTQVADAGRTAVGAAIAARPEVRGYVRMVVGKTCSRCLILAGRRYEWNEGFKRHPRCDCRHVPVGEDVPDDITTNPRAYFDSLSEAEQDAAFGKAGAAAIREGADMARVVNARRGMFEADGRLFTTEAAGKRPRLMPEQILRDAEDRDDAIRLLRRHGYITGRPATPAPVKAAPKPAPKKQVPAPVARPKAAPKPPTFAERVQVGVTDRQRLGGGVAAQTERVTLADGSTAIYKKASDSAGELAVVQQDAEELGALVAKSVGLRAPEIYRASADEVYMTLMPGDVADELAGDVLEALRDSDEGARLGLADLLMGNFDRNGGNLLVSDGRIAAIDHGASFQWFDGLNEPGRPPMTRADWFHRFVDDSGDEWAENPLSSRDVETLRERLTGLRPEFARLDRLDWFDGMMGRLAAIARFANGRGLL